MRDVAYLEKYLKKILKTDLLNGANLIFTENSKHDIRNKKDLIIYVDEGLDNYIEEKRTETRASIQKYEDTIKGKVDELLHLERKYKSEKSEEIKEKLEESILIAQIEVEGLKENPVPNLKVQDIIGYVLNNGKVSVLNFEYREQKFTMQEFGTTPATIKILKSVS